MSSLFKPALAILSFALAWDCTAGVRVLDAKTYHLRSGAEPEWQEFAGKRPYGPRLDLRFTATTNQTESTLFIRQSDVKRDWNVELNGKRIGKLFLMEASLVFAMPVASGFLRDGENVLSIVPPRENDDILVSDFRLDDRPLERAFEACIQVHITDADSRGALPCRITIVDEQGALAPLYAKPDQHLAARPGVVYTGDGHAQFNVPPGRYTVYGSRGFEYGLATRSVSATAGRTNELRLTLRREVPTPGLVSCDTHIHTGEYARHGDASLEERILTIAGEGIELPVSTEHNTLVDFASSATRLGLQEAFTSVLGCEVTTRSGHFNAFPIPPANPVPDVRLASWPELMKSIRERSGARVIVLNHPRDEHDGFIPFASTNFNPVTGENLRGFEFGFDAMELINSGALRSDWRQVYQDWFALLNYGCHVTGVAASDSHDVSRFIVGQGRTYVECREDQAGAINIEEACSSLKQGRALVSLGLLVLMKVDDKFGVGDLATVLGRNISVTITVLGPTWTTAGSIELYANGILVREGVVKRGSTAIEKAKVHWTIPRTVHDVYLVAIATGPGVTSPHWAIPRPYQPTSPGWESRVIGSTNPIWVDGDGDGRFTSPRAYARGILEKFGSKPAALLPALSSYDEAIAAQAAGLCQSGGSDVRSREFIRLLPEAAAQVRRGFAAFERTLGGGK